MVKQTHGTVTDIERAASSRNGNPSWFITLDNGTRYRTETDGAVGYVVGNVSVGETHTLTLTRAGRVCDIPTTREA